MQIIVIRDATYIFVLYADYRCKRINIFVLYADYRYKRRNIYICFVCRLSLQETQHIYLFRMQIIVIRDATYIFVLYADYRCKRINIFVLYADYHYKRRNIYICFVCRLSL